MRQGLRYREPTPFSNSSSYVSNSGGNGVCMMSTSWRNEQHASFIKFISCFLDTNSFRLKIVPIAPVTILLSNSSVLEWIFFLCLNNFFLQDFIFNCGGVSVAFIFETNWDSNNTASIFKRVNRLKEQFAHLYVVVTLPTKEQNDSFVRSYFKFGMELGRPTFVPVQDLEMGFEKIVKISHARGVCKRQDAISKLKAERERSVQTMDVYVKVITSIPGIDSHDANALNQAIGSIEAIAKASKEDILENTDLSADKAETITRFFRDPTYYLSPKIS